MNPIQRIPINDKSNDSKEQWQNELLQTQISVFDKGRGVICIQAPTGSGKSRGVRHLLEKYNINNPLIIKKGGHKNTTVPDQWRNKENINAVSIPSDNLSFDEFRGKISEKGIDYDEIDCFVFDEAHENFAFLFYGHGCHVRHQTEDRLVTFANRYDQSKLQPIYEMANKTPIILLSDTLTCIICEELPMYSGLLPIDIIVVEPELSYYRDIPEFDHVDKSEAEDHIYNNYLMKESDHKIIIYVDQIKYSEELKDKLIRLGINKTKIASYNSKSGFPSNISLYPITIFVDGGASGIDDKDVKIVYSLRSEESTVDSNLADGRINISYDLRQRIGRIRGIGGKVILIREDIDRDTYIRSIKESYQRSIDSNVYYEFFWKNHDNTGFTNADAIQSQRVPGLLMNLVKNDRMQPNSQKNTLIQSFRKKIEENKLFFENIKNIMKDPINLLTKDVSQCFNSLIIEFSKIFRDFMKVTQKISNEYQYTENYIEQRKIRLIKDECHENSQLKQELYNGFCEICGEERDIGELDLARIKEGKDGGEYLETNTILCTPDIHRGWDMGNYVFFKGVEKIEFRVSDFRMEKRNIIIMVRKNMEQIIKTFKRVDLSYLDYRLSNELSHE